MDDLIRLAAFNWLNEQRSLGDDILPRILLQAGFLYQNRVIHVIGPQGIFTPQVMELPLSITTTPKSIYRDKTVREGVYKYSYRGTDRDHRDNVGLRNCMRLENPDAG